MSWAGRRNNRRHAVLPRLCARPSARVCSYRGKSCRRFAAWPDSSACRPTPSVLHGACSCVREPFAPTAGAARPWRTSTPAPSAANAASTGIPDPALLPDLSRAFHSFTTARVPGGYLDSPVLPELVEQLRGDWPHKAQRFTVVDGAMDALEIATRSFVRFGDRVIVENPCF